MMYNTCWSCLNITTFIGRPLVSMGSNNDANDDDNEKTMNTLIVAIY